MLWFKLLLHKLFPKWYGVEDLIEEIGFDERITNQFTDYVRTKYIKWNVMVDDADIVVHVKHSYFHGDELIGEKLIDVKTKYRFAHPVPEHIKVKDKQIMLSRVKATPVFSIGGAMYDVTKFWFPDYSSTQLKTGKLLKKTKSAEDIDREYQAWRSDLSASSDEIMMNARC